MYSFLIIKMKVKNDQKMIFVVFIHRNISANLSKGRDAKPGSYPIFFRMHDRLQFLIVLQPVYFFDLSKFEAKNAFDQRRNLFE